MVATLLATAGLSIGLAGEAPALQTADFSVSSANPNVDESVTFTPPHSATSTLPVQWRWYRTIGNDRLAATMGEGRIDPEEIQYAFSSAGQKLVVLKVTNSTLTHGFATAQSVVTAQSIVTVVGGPEETRHRTRPSRRRRPLRRR